MAKLFSTYSKSRERAFHVRQWSIKNDVYSSLARALLGEWIQHLSFSCHPAGTFSCGSRTPSSVPLHCVIHVRDVERRRDCYWEIYYDWPLFSSPQTEHNVFWLCRAKWDLWKPCSVSVIITKGGNRTLQQWGLLKRCRQATPTMAVNKCSFSLISMEPFNAATLVATGVLAGG